MTGSASLLDGGRDTFWTWRRAMYDLADSLTPDSIYTLSRQAYGELACAGILTVGEFHYVHHQRGGAPYDARTVTSDAVIQAARDAGIRITLLRVIYERGGPGLNADALQRRFCDGDLEDSWRDIESLRARYAGADDVQIGVAPHSVRAVSPETLARIASMSDEWGLLVHMHVAEQRREVELCQAETGRRPVELLADCGLLTGRFTAVHATHILPAEAMQLGQAGARVCLCPTTEWDLGDGLPDVGALLRAGVQLCTGVDSHVRVDPLGEMRGIELGERIRTGGRSALPTDDGAAHAWGGGAERVDAETPAERLWRWGSSEGGAALGFADAGGWVEIDADAPELLGVPADRLLDAIVFSGGTGLVGRTQRS